MGLKGVVTEERSGLEGMSNTRGKTTGGCASDSHVLTEECRGLNGAVGVNR